MHPPQRSRPSLSRKSLSCLTSNTLGVLGFSDINRRLLTSFQCADCCVSFTHARFALCSSSAVREPSGFVVAAP